MISAVERYLTVRRAAGFELKNADYLLRSFARLAAEQKTLAWQEEGERIARI
jgi:hypothetical protein